VEGGHTRGRHEHGEDDLGAVPGRGDGVGAEDGQRNQLAETLGDRILGGQRAADQQSLEERARGAAAFPAARLLLRARR
jgi:hypothetical protein